MGKKDQILSICLIKELKGAFHTSSIHAKEKKIWFIMDLLCHTTKNYWDVIAQYVTMDDMETMT